MPYFAVFDRIAPAQNKYMATLFNANAPSCSRWVSAALRV